jgi:signal transduction histidine kinase
MTNISLERKMEVNAWLIKARWFYGLGVFIIGVLTRVLSQSNIDFSIFSMVSLLVIFLLANFVAIGFYRLVKKNKTYLTVLIFSCFQMSIELSVLAVVMYKAGGIESISYVFFFMPVVSAAFLFGTLGSIVTAFFSTIIINAMIILEYYDVIHHVYRYGIPTLEFENLSIALTKTITVSLFYLIVSIYSSYGAELLISREKSLAEKTDLLDKKSKLLIKREKKLFQINTLLSEERNKIFSIISNITDPIIFIDVKGSISLFNKAAKDILEFDDKVIGKKVVKKDNYSINNFKGLIKSDFEIKKIVDDNGDIIDEEMTLDYHGQQKFYKVISATVNDKDKIIYGHLKIFYDLTRERAIDKMKSEFISIAAHQLRTPLSAIKWVIKMILDGDTGKLNAEQEELLTKGYKGNERIIELVNDLLNVSRIEEGRFGYNFKKDSFEEVFNNVLEDIENIAKNGKVKLIVNRPKNIPKVYMDKERLALVLQNLVENAIKYTPENGKVELSVIVEEKMLRVIVKDNGVGVPEIEKSKLFSKFFRASNVMRMQTEGSGLGLFIAKNIIEKHGGQIKLKSQEGKGTEINFTLPLNKI